jgi:hypothetical protein
MSEAKDVLLIIGSAKRPASTSASLGGYLLERLAERGLSTGSVILHRALSSDGGQEELLRATDRCSLLVLAFPLYVDSLPALVIKTLEQIARRREGEGDRPPQRLMVIINCGFPEPSQNDTALRICRRFATEAGFDWAGALALGAGETIHGQSLDDVKGMAHNVIKSLNMAAEALAESKPVPQEAVRLMARPLIPRWSYLWFGKRRWRKSAKRHGTRDRLNDRPYMR